MTADPVWAAFVELARRCGPVLERTSRYGDKPALWVEGREIAHTDQPGRVDLRLTRKGWLGLREAWGNDPALHHEASRRDWLELRLSGPDEVDRLAPVIEAAVSANS